MADAIVYVIDDEIHIRNSMRRLLKSVGLEVRTFPSALEFLDAFDPERDGCVVTDVRLPEMSGLELQEELARRGWTIPVILISGVADVSMAVRSMKAGAVDFVEKPVDGQILLERIQQALAWDRKRRVWRHERSQLRARLDRLTARQRQVLELVVEGLTSRQIAARLDLSQKTVHVHRAEATAKMKAGSVAELARLAVTAGVGIGPGFDPDDELGPGGVSGGGGRFTQRAAGGEVLAKV